MAEQTGWGVADSKTNAIATAAKAAEAGKQHVVYSVDASFASTATGLLQILDGVTVVWEGYVYDFRDVSFEKGLSITRGSACSAVLAASGGPLQKVNLHGITR